MPVHRTPLARLLVAVGLGLATFLAVRPALTPPAGASLVEVLVATRAVPAGRTLGPADVRLARLPSDALPSADPARSPVGRTTRIDLVPGEVVLAGRLGPRGLAALLPPGSRALAVPRAAGTPPLEPLQRADLLSGGAVVVAAATVLAVEDSGTTVAVPEAAAPVVAAAIAAGTVTLALAG